MRPGRSVDTARPGTVWEIDPDWLGMGAKSLVLWFYGTAGNDANKPMYVKLVDGSSNNWKVAYDGDINDIRVEDWHEWNIDLQTFANGGVDLSNVKTIMIGFGDGNQTSPDSSTDGTVYFEDVQLYTTRCALVKRDPDFAKVDYAPAGVPAGDCIVDYLDLQEMSNVWLDRDQLVDTNRPGDSNLVVWFPMNSLAPPDYNKMWNYMDTNHPDVCDTNSKWTAAVLEQRRCAIRDIITPHGRRPAMTAQAAASTWTASRAAGFSAEHNYGNLRFGIGAKSIQMIYNAITLSAWVKWLGPRTWDAYLNSKCQGILGKRSGWDDTSMIWMFWVMPMALAIQLASGILRLVTPPHQIWLPSAGILYPYIGQWIHLAATFPNPPTATDANSPGQALSQWRPSSSRAMEI